MFYDTLQNQMSKRHNMEFGIAFINDFLWDGHDCLFLFYSSQAWLKIKVLKSKG